MRRLKRKLSTNHPKLAEMKTGSPRNVALNYLSVCKVLIIKATTIQLLFSQLRQPRVAISRALLPFFPLGALGRRRTGLSQVQDTEDVVPPRTTRQPATPSPANGTGAP